VRSIVYLFYGLAFFAMGLIVLLERGRAGDERLRHALLPLAVFGLIHGLHEWQEMLEPLGALPGLPLWTPVWDALHLGLIAFSFLSLAEFGASLLSPTPEVRRISLLLPLVMAAVWAAGLMVLRGRYVERELFLAAEVWGRYVLGIPGAAVAAGGLVAQQRAFRRAGMEQFGRDTLWAAVAFIWYGLIGQLFTQASPIWPSTFLNQNLFLELFGFPVQVVRALAAIFAAFFVVRSLRSFEVETQRKIEELQEARLAAAEEREALRGDLLRRVVAAQEAERQRIARELHDETGQKLTAIGLGLRGVRRGLEGNGQKVVNNLGQLEDLVDSSLTELQRLIGDLRPSHLDDLGLPAALRWYANELRHRLDVPVVVVVTGRERELTSPVKIALFRVAQEALTNVIKHAGATEVIVRLCYGPELVTVMVADNGAGFDVDAKLTQTGRTSFGLLGMRERAALCDGQFVLISDAGKGTQIRVSIPYQLPLDTPEEEPDHDHSLAAG
jgi:signal transduction histidine kinase